MPRAKELTTLGLQLPTDPRWTNLAEMSLEDILTDHAYCEQKAASACISLVQQFPDKVELVRQVSPVVTEEWGHFRLVIQELDKRNLKLGFQRKDLYVHGLLSFQKKGGSREDRLLDQLLTCALIEARSCERFKLLSQELEDEELQKFYHHFMVSEAGHYKMFIELSEYYFPKEIVRKRWEQFLDHEEKLMASMEIRGDRMH
ncbi:MAG TPA: tRNA-(ms[2]io[6]A)-hydroxylase [Saprospiraceae bacterium]|nr:tRNA-(ms[2]io[6]A)-hydroxylase [Saprospiraceae bacterium]